MVDWKQVRSLARESLTMEKQVDGYSYADRHSSIATDEKLCRLVIGKVSDAKSSIFSIIDLLFELEKKEPVSVHMQRIKDELDIFSDEIKVRHCEWKGLNVKWTVNLVKHDYDIVTGLERLNGKLGSVYDKMLADKALLSDDELAEARLWKAMKKEIPAIEELVDSLVELFKEREGICNLRPAALEKTYKSIQERIERQI
jgi:hypothetical protein